MALEWSHGKRRPTARTASGDVPALPAPPPGTAEADRSDRGADGRFAPGNGAARRRQVKERARGIATLDPKRVPSWLSPYVSDGLRVAAELAERFPDDAALRPLIGGAVDSYVVFRALLALGATGDTEALKESRAWLREHRSAIATIAALANETPAPPETAEQMRARILGGKP